jgi:squalene-hopene/tetraprenyl-beta-curcumene cyclase
VPTGRIIDHPQSTVEETALAVEALCGAVEWLREDEDGPALAKALADGVAWLVRAVETKHWTESSPIGFYFAKLWYYEQLYPLIFTVSALGAALQHAAQRAQRQLCQEPASARQVAARQPSAPERPVPPELAHPHPVSLTR